MILELLLQTEDYVDIAHIINTLRISRRTFFYTLKKLNIYLEDHDMDPVQNVKGVGYYLPKISKEKLHNYLKKQNDASNFFSQQDRHILLALSLINHDRVSLELHKRHFSISHHTAVSDLQSVKKTIQKYQLQLRKTSTGTVLIGNEFNQRIWFLTALGDHSSLINGNIAINPSDTLKINKFLHILEKSTGNYFSDDTFTSLMTFFSWYLSRLKQDKRYWLDTKLDNNLREEPDTISIWASELLSQYQIHSTSEQRYIVFLVKSGQLVQINPKIAIVRTLTPIVKKIISRFNEVSGTLIPVDSLELPLLTHLISTYYRVKYQVPFKQTSLKNIANEYIDLISFIRLALEPFEKFLKKRLPNEEVILVAIYFGATLRRENKIESTVDIVCSSGIGTSKVLYNELQFRYPNVNFYTPMSVFKLKNSNTQNGKLIISTVSLKTEWDVPIIVVAPIPTKSQWKQIEKELIKLKIIKQPSSIITVSNLMDIISEYARISGPSGLEVALSKLISKDKYSTSLPIESEISIKEILSIDNIMITANTLINWEDAVYFAFAPLLKKKIVTKHYVDQIICSTKKYGSYMAIGNEVMLAHAKPTDGVKKVGMSLLVLKKPVSIYDQLTDQEKIVSVIIGLAPVNAVKHVQALSQLVELLQKPNWLKKIKTSSNPETIYENLL